MTKKRKKPFTHISEPWNHLRLDESISHAQFCDSEEFDYSFVLFNGKSLDGRKEIDTLILLDLMIERYGREEVISGYYDGYKNCILFMTEKLVIDAMKRLNQINEITKRKALVIASNN